MSAGGLLLRAAFVVARPDPPDLLARRLADVVDAPAEPSTEAAVGDTGGTSRSPRVLELGDVRVLATDCPSRPVTDPPAVLEHARWATAAWRLFPATVPFRFGQWFRDEEEALARLGVVRDELLRSLELTRDAAEFTVRVLERGRDGGVADGARPTGDADPTAGGGGPSRASASPGRTHLAHLAAQRRDLRARESRARSLAFELGEPLRTFLRAEAWRLPADGRGLVSISHLLDRELERPYRSRLAELAEERQDVRLSLTGPWPPWSFGPGLEASTPASPGRGPEARGGEA